MSTYCNYWNKVSLVKSKIKQSKKIDSIGIGLASPEEIRRWGERRLPNGTLIGKVDKDHTVDYESLKPIEGGLFCERIFGPVEDFYCSCERKGEKNEKFCPNCEVEFTKSRVRRIRMGYIPLAVPVVHVWYLRGRPSYIANLVGKSRNSIDRLAYGETLCESFIGSSSLESIYKKEENFFQDYRLLRNSTSLLSSSSLLPNQAFQPPVAQHYGNEQNYFKFHTLPLFSTFVYKEWSHRFSFLDYFIWSPRNNDLVLPFYAYQNNQARQPATQGKPYGSLYSAAKLLTPSQLRKASPSSALHVKGLAKLTEGKEAIRTRSRVNICESIRKSSLNLIRNKFSLRFSNQSNLSLNSLEGSATNSYELLRQPATNSYGLLRVRRKKGKPLYVQSRRGVRGKVANELNSGTSGGFLRNPSSSQLLTPTDCFASEGKKASPFGVNSYLLQRSQRQAPLRAKRGLPCEAGWGLEVCSAFSTVEQYTKSTPLNKIDTQQFPRLTELLNFTGGAALRNLLSRFNLIVLSKFLRHELKNLELKVNNLLALKMLTYSQGLLLGKLAKRRSKQIRRLKLLELFQSQKSNPEWMILSVIPVLPPDLRPILRVNDDFVVASDLNRLYQTVLRRNNTIHERLDDPLPCPESGLFRQRSLQKAVDGLLENGKGGGTPLCASKRRPLVSLSHVLKGKKGLFRQHLLGKRVDYSGRSVIVVGPRLQLHECGLPKEMAIELFQPFLLHRLKVKGLATSNTTARRMIQQGDPVIWHILKQLVYEHPVLLNRAPTLHRLGIQAFQPRLVSGRAILLHPLVCNGFNADFDGDQMAVHVPLSFQARAEAWKIMLSKNNFLSPATGQPILVPSQDMVLGCYYLSVSIPRILDSFAPNANMIRSGTSGGFLRNPSHELGDPYLQSTVKNNVVSRTSTSCYTQRACEAEKQIKDVNGLLKQSTFLNENKGHYFSNLEDSLLAYFQGRLQTHTPFWVRIDPVSFPLVTNNSQLHKPKFTYGSRRGLAFCHIAKRGRACVAEKQSWVSLKPLLCVRRKGVSNCLPPLGTRRGTDASFARNNNRFLPASRPKENPYFVSEGKELVALPLAASQQRWNQRQNEMKGRPSFASHVSNSSTSCASPTGSYELNKEANHNVLTPSGYAKQPVNRPNIDALKLTFLQPLYGSSQEMCKTLFQNQNKNIQIHVEGNETIESPLEVRLSIDGNLANILTMFQNHYNYNATWIKQCKEESIKYMRTTAGRVVINKSVFKDV